MSAVFCDFARSHGLELDRVQGVDRIYRCPTTNKPKRKNGAYMLRHDGNGWVIAYDMGGQLEWFDDPQSQRGWDDGDRRRWLEWKRREEQRQRHGWTEAAKRAQAMLASAKPGRHAYLQYKGLDRLQGLVLPDGGLVVPMRNLTTNEVQGAQVIRWAPDDRDPRNSRYEKKYLWGSNPRLAVLRLGDTDAERRILCEGWATGLSILEGVRQLRLVAQVLVCFSDTGLVKVAEALANAPYPRCVIADNDDIPPAERAKRDAGEPYDGRGPGEIAAARTGLPFVMPGFLGFDANDVYRKHGLMALSRLVMDAVRAT